MTVICLPVDGINKLSGLTGLTISNKHGTLDYAARGDWRKSLKLEHNFRTLLIVSNVFA